jgi:putative transposase
VASALFQFPSRQLRTASLAWPWVGEVTYLKSAGRWRYLAVVLDRHSRRVLGWKLGLNRDLTLTLRALNLALARRASHPGLIFHSDRGVEYSAYAFRARLAALGVTQSMKRPREIGDNAFIESFFHSMKADAIHARTFDDDHPCIESSASTCVATTAHDCIRRWGYRSPIDYEHVAV